MEYSIRIRKLSLTDHSLTISLDGRIDDPAIDPNTVTSPKVVLYFDNGKENRRIPMVLKSIQYLNGTCLFSGQYTYRLDCIYWNTRHEMIPSVMQLNFTYGNDYQEGIPFVFEPEEDPFELQETTVSTSNEQENDPNIIHSDRWHLEVEQDRIVCTPLPAPRPTFKHYFKKIFIAPLAFVFSVLNYLLAVCLVPWYILEVFLSYFGIAKLDSKIKSRNPIRRLIGNINQRIYKFTNIKISLTAIYKKLIIFTYKCCKRFCSVQPNRITFISMRRTDLSGNFAFVYEQMKDRKDLNIQFILTYNQSIFMPFTTFFRFCHACAVSKVIVLDEYTPQIHYIDLNKETKLVQLWHACGAFKTFGFTRLGKPKGSPQVTRMHRSYDYVTVSSTYCKKCHSEGFGISDEKVVPTGIARTDVFFDQAYRKKVTDEFYQQYPDLKGKKLVMFAPTFRGDIKETAHYPMEMFNVKTVCDAIGDDYVILVKHHPFIQQQHPIPEAYRDRVLDLSANTELNDLLFVTDLIITDYSSLIFEASLLKIPMLFYVYDLQSYIRNRDFYFDLRLNSPGKLVYSQEELIRAIQQQDYQPDRMDAFAKMFFDDFDGKSTERIVDLIEKARLE